MIDFNKIRRYSIHERKSKISIVDLVNLGKQVHFPDTISKKDFDIVIKKIKNAKNEKRQIIWGIGAHVIKCGLSLYIIELMKNGFITCIATNGAAAIHDSEIALFGKTSEYVEEAIKDGSFGFCEETGKFINNAIVNGVKKGYGYGKSIGKAIIDSNAKYINYSIFANAVKYKIPITVHVAIGTDITHMHPECDGAAIGKTSYDDFKTFCEVVTKLDGGVYLNVGSAVILPEVFLKSVSVARNLKRLKNFTTVNIDFKKLYRPEQNVVKRHDGYSFIEKYEIMIPLITNALLKL
ncbi:MAG: hypothetical protein QXD48_03010 [Candidatus Aenigmatarchaeota archaeon]